MLGSESRADGPAEVRAAEEMRAGSRRPLFSAVKRKTARELSQGGFPVNCVDLPVCLLPASHPRRGESRAPNGQKPKQIQALSPFLGFSHLTVIRTHTF